MTHGSLFSGIGGFDLAAEWMRWENVFHCEWNEFGRKVLNHYWPEAKSYEDITKTDFNIYRGRIDILSGGFPCQPYSSAGKRLGKEDDRHLWPEMLRAVREIQPRYVVAENVLGLVNWNEGLVFNEVQADLEAEGYEVQPFVLPACAIGAPHRRYRVWFVSRLISNTCSNGQCRSRQFEKSGYDNTNRITFNESSALSIRGASSNADSKRQQRGVYKEDGKTTVRHDAKSLYEREDKHEAWENFPTKHPVCSGNDGISNRLDGITFLKWRSESIKAYGNAIVPQVAHEIFKALIK
jgi:DNA (cytosine-5)-methyltransferase 1